MTFKSIFNNPEFDNRFDHLKTSIKEYLNEVDYDLGDLMKLSDGTIGEQNGKYTQLKNVQQT